MCLIGVIVVLLGGLVVLGLRLVKEPSATCAVDVECVWTLCMDASTVRFPLMTSSSTLMVAATTELDALRLHLLLRLVVLY